MHMLSRFFATVLVICIGLANVNAQAKSVLDIQTWSTQNGVPVYFVASPGIPILDIKLLFDAGSRLDDTQPGLAYMTGMMLEEGTSNYDKEALVKGFEDIAASFSVNTGKDMASLNLRTLTKPDVLDTSLTLFHSILTSPIFPESGFKRIQAQVLQGLARRQESASTVASDAFYKNLYASQPYATPTVGTEASITQLTPTALKSFYDAHYTTGNAKLVMVGDLTTKQAKQIANKLVKGLRKVKKTKHTPAPAAKNAAARVNKTLPVPQTAIILGTLGLGPKDDNFFNLLVGNTAFGSMPLVSTLFEEVREKKGYAYGVSSQFSTMLLTGPFAVRLQTQNAQVDAAITLVQQLLQHLTETGLTQTQLDTAKNYLLGQFPLNFDSNRAILSQTAFLAFYDYDLNYFDTYREKVKQTTLESVNTALKNHFKDADWVVVTAGGAA